MAQPPLISLRDARVTFGGDPLFDGVELHLVRGERAALVGRNGSGKSTLMKCIVGALEQDGGERYAEPGVEIAWLEQDPIFEKGQTVFDFIALSGGEDHEIEAAITRMQLDGARMCDTLSGGEKRRTALARTFIRPPDVLLLDEPTNHLDLATIEWLERTLNDFKGALLVVSHDRTFLTNVTNRIFWLERGTVRSADKGFGHFDDWVQETLEAEEAAARKLDSKLVDEARWLLRGVTARRRRNQGRLRKLEDMRAQRASLLQTTGRVKAKIEDGEIRSKLVIEAKSITKRFGGESDDGDNGLLIIDDFSTRILRGDRIGILGPNGAGKTTLLRMLIGEMKPDAGSVRVGKQLRCAYFDQQRAVLDPKATLQSTLCGPGSDVVNVLGQMRHVRAYLKDFLFDPRKADQNVGSLSGGERNRLLLAQILTRPSDLLVLDEPTNDLDMDTLDLLLDLLSDYAGTLLLVSHDRDFLDKTVSSTIAMEGDGRAVEYPGGYQDYLAQRKQKTGGQTADKAKRGATPASPAAPKTRSQLSYKDQRELDGLPDAIASLETEIDGLKTALADPALFGRDGAAFNTKAKRLEEAQVELGEAENRWLELETMREEMETRRATTASGASAGGNA
jgi:ATP-binding cassette subfamily F protein uup